MISIITITTSITRKENEKGKEGLIIFILY